jgi:uncharacterized RDD family membrane protein YckC
MPPPTTKLEPASLARRFAALCYDLLLLAALLFCFTLLVLAARGGRAVEPGTVWFEVGLIAIAMLFYCGFWVHGGQTLGMRAWRIRVVTASGGPLGWGRSAARFWAGILAALPAGLGLWWSLVDAERRGWHDRLSGTRVVRAAPPAVIAPGQASVP